MYVHMYFNLEKSGFMWLICVHSSNFLLCEPMNVCLHCYLMHKSVIVIMESGYARLLLVYLHVSEFIPQVFGTNISEVYVLGKHISLVRLRVSSFFFTLILRHYQGQFRV